MNNNYIYPKMLHTRNIILWLQKPGPWIAQQKREMRRMKCGYIEGQSVSKGAEKKTNNEVLNQVKVKREVLKTIKTAQLRVCQETQQYTEDPS